MTVIELLTSALRKAGVLATGETPPSEMANEALETLNMLLGSLSVEGLNLHYQTRESFTLTASQASYTWGSGGNFNSARPVRILGAFIRDNNIDYPVDIITAGEYREIVDKTTETTEPEYLYYNPTYPLGTVLLYPVPSTSATLHIDSEKYLTEYTATSTTIALPSEYLLLLRDNLTIMLADDYGVPVTQTMMIAAQQHKDNLQRLNAATMVEVIDTDILNGGRRYSIYSDE